MQKIDLIISAIEDALKDFKTDSYDNNFHRCCGADVDVGHFADCKLAQALAAARSLRELEPVSKQPEALRLAELLDGDKSAHHEESATELRRLHEINQELLEALKRIAAPNALNADHRVEACREALREIARAVIAKAEGESNEP